MKLKPDAEVQLVIDNGLEKLQYNGQVKEIDLPMVSVYLPGQKDSEMFPSGSYQTILFPGEKTGKLKVKIEKNQALPNLDLRILNLVGTPKKAAQEEKLEEISLKSLLNEIYDDDYRNLRSSLRVQDSFPVEFYLQSPEKIQEKEKSYSQIPTKERRKRFLLDKGIMPAQVYNKINSMESDYFDVFSDIYRKLAIMSGIDVEMEPDEQEERQENARPENLGTCVDMSGTGLRFLCGTRFKPKDILKMIISPTAAKPRFSVSTLVDVVKTILVKDASPSERYAVVVTFRAINPEDMETMIQYTILRQMEQSKQKSGM